MTITETVDDREKLDNGNNIIEVYMDLSNAFPIVNHEILLNKFSFCSVRGYVNK